MMERGQLRVVCLASALLMCGCPGASAPPVPISGGADVCDSRVDGLTCDEGRAIVCEGGRVQSLRDCSDREQVCHGALGCVTCWPGAYACDGARLLQCEPSGETLSFVEECAAGTFCSPRGCRDLCGEAESQRSYVGCEYWPVFVANDQLSPLFRPAVAIGNANLVSADVTITRGDAPPITRQVAPGEAEVIELEYGALQSADDSQLVRQGAYRLVSSVPVTVHQFNPLRFEVPSSDGGCGGPTSDAGVRPVETCFSFSNDASLLLPAHVFVRPAGEPLTYMALSRASFVLIDSEEDRFAEPGFLAVIATGDRSVHARVKVSAHTQAERLSGDAGPEDAGQADAGGDAGTVDGGSGDAGLDAGSLDGGATGGGGIRALAPGDTLEVDLAPGDVLSLLSAVDPPCADEPVAIQNGYSTCSPPAGYDLTGSEVVADGPIQVISGHNCTNVPSERAACDHLEESMFPVDTWGLEAVLPRPVVKVGRPYLLRVVSSVDGNEVRFDPAIHEPVRLDRGQWFETSSSEHVLVRANQPILVAQTLTGQGDSLDREGDPAMSLAIPSEQFRGEYVFSTPPSYSANFVSVIALRGDSIALDGRTLTGFSAVGESDFEVTAVSVVAGTHLIRSQKGGRFGIVLYGVGAYTSYLMPGGLDLNVIAVPL